MSEFFPSIEQIKGRVVEAQAEAQAAEAEAQARAARWREENLAMVREFLEKMREAGVVPPDAVLNRRGWTIAGRGGVALTLMPELTGLPGCWIWHGWPIGVDKHVVQRFELEDLEELSTWEPSWLRSALMQHLPR